MSVLETTCVACGVPWVGPSPEGHECLRLEQYGEVFTVVLRMLYSDGNRYIVRAVHTGPGQGWVIFDEPDEEPPGETAWAEGDVEAWLERIREASEAQAGHA